MFSAIKDSKKHWIYKEKTFKMPAFFIA